MSARGKLLAFFVILMMSLIVGCSTDATVVKPNPEIDGYGTWGGRFGNLEVTLDLPARVNRDVKWITDYIDSRWISPSELQPMLNSVGVQRLVAVGDRRGVPTCRRPSLLGFEPPCTVSSFTVRNATSETVACENFRFTLRFKDGRSATSETIARLAEKYGVTEPMKADPWLTISNGTEKVSPGASGISYRAFGTHELVNISEVSVFYRGKGGGTKDMTKL